MALLVWIGVIVGYFLSAVGLYRAGWPRTRVGDARIELRATRAAQWRRSNG